MRDGGGAWENLAVRRVRESRDAFGQGFRELVARVVASEQKGAAAQHLSGLETLAVEIAGGPDCRRTEGENYGRFTRVEKSRQCRVK